MYRLYRYVHPTMHTRNQNKFWNLHVTNAFLLGLQSEAPSLWAAAEVL